MVYEMDEMKKLEMIFNNFNFIQKLNLLIFYFLFFIFNNENVNEISPNFNFLIIYKFEKIWTYALKVLTL